MPIIPADVKYKLPKVVSDAASNGGRISNTNVSMLFPNVSGLEREAGITRYRKCFYKNEQSNANLVDLTLYNAMVYLETESPGDDYYQIIVGTDTDVQSDAEGYTGWCGVGALNASVTAGTGLVVRCPTNTGFEDGALICITDGINREFARIVSHSWADMGTYYTCTIVCSGFLQNYDDVSAIARCDIFTSGTIGKSDAAYTTNEFQNMLVEIFQGTGASQTRRIASNTATTITVTYPFMPGPAADSDYRIIKTYVSQVAELGDAVASYDSWAITGSGTYDTANYPVILYPVGAVTQTWTLHFTSATEYNLVADELGTIVTGQTKASDCSPPNGSSPYFKLSSGGFGGTWGNGDEITFKTYGSYKAFWAKQVVGTNIATCGDNTFNIHGLGDTE